jgi:hypothetical protein
MKYLLFFLIFFSSFIFACGDKDKIEGRLPFAEQLVLEDESSQVFYEITVPDKNGQFFLTSITFELPDIISGGLDFDDAYGYKGYYSAHLSVNSNTVNNVLIHLSYSTTEDRKGFVLYGAAKTYTLSSLIGSKRPKKVIPPPPKPVGE